MNPVKLMAKMTAKGVLVSGAGGGLVEVSRADVAAALAFAGVSVTADRLVRFLYCADAAQAPLLQAALVHELRRSVAVERAQLYSLVRLALDELSGQRVCATCCGHGTVGVKACDVCAGSGLKAWSQRQRATAIGVADTTFRRNLEGHADTVYQYVAAMANTALASLSEQFSDRAA